MNGDFEVIGLTELGNEPESTAPEADALSTWSCDKLIPSALL